jgi:activator of HSP90 ATPase
MNETLPPTGAFSFTRRQALAGIAVAFGSLASGARVLGAPSDPTAPAAKTVRSSLHYEQDFKGGPERIYGVLTDAKQFAAMTGRAAEIDATEGGSFSLFGGLIAGRNVELVPNKRVVQAWRPTHWDPGYYSIVQFEFSGMGSQTHMVLDHRGYPVDEADGLDSGWKGHYLDPLAKFLP